MNTILTKVLIFESTLAMLFALIFASSAFAWDDFGHMAVAYIAYQKLTPQTRARANALLKLNPYYGKWKELIAENKTSKLDQDQVIFMLAATCPDAIKHDQRYVADGDEGGFRPSDTVIANQNIGYSDMNLHKYWHFVDQAFSTDGTTLPSLPKPNAETQIAAFRKVIASNSPNTLKSYDLTWLIHLVGDVHQPLHCITRASAQDPSGDKGGNDVKLDCYNCPTELHAYWDQVLGTSEEPREVIHVAKRLYAADPRMSKDLTVKDWLSESYKLARYQIYAGPIRAGNGPFRLDHTYKENAWHIAANRVELAGTRLANLLNNELRLTP